MVSKIGVKRGLIMDLQNSYEKTMEQTTLSVLCSDDGSIIDISFDVISRFEVLKNASGMSGRWSPSDKPFLLPCNKNTLYEVIGGDGRDDEETNEPFEVFAWLFDYLDGWNDPYVKRRTCIYYVPRNYMEVLETVLMFGSEEKDGVLNACCIHFWANNIYNSISHILRNFKSTAQAKAILYRKSAYIVNPKDINHIVREGLKSGLLDEKDWDISELEDFMDKWHHYKPDDYLVLGWKYFQSVELFTKNFFRVNLNSGEVEFSVCSDVNSERKTARFVPRWTSKGHIFNLFGGVHVYRNGEIVLRDTGGRMCLDLGDSESVVHVKQSCHDNGLRVVITRQCLHKNNYKPILRLYVLNDMVLRKIIVLRDVPPVYTYDDVIFYMHIIQGKPYGGLKGMWYEPNLEVRRTVLGIPTQNEDIKCRKRVVGDVHMRLVKHHVLTGKICQEKKITIFGTPMVSKWEMSERFHNKRHYWIQVGQLRRYNMPLDLYNYSFKRHDEDNVRHPLYGDSNRDELGRIDCQFVVVSLKKRECDDMNNIAAELKNVVENDLSYKGQLLIVTDMVMPSLLLPLFTIVDATDFNDL